MDQIVGLGLLAALVGVIVMFGILFGRPIAAAAQRVAEGDATGADLMAALTFVGITGSDGGGCDAGGGGCD